MIRSACRLDGSTNSSCIGRTVFMYCWTTEGSERPRASMSRIRRRTKRMSAGGSTEGLVWVDQPLHPRDDRVDGHLILPTFGDDQVSVSLGWLDELFVHRADGVHVLLDDRGKRAAARLDVAHQAADEADVGGCVDEELDVD